MELFNERFKVFQDEIDNNDLFIENIKINVDSIINFNECNACEYKPDRLRVVLYQINMPKDVWVVTYCAYCCLEEKSYDYAFIDVFLNTQTKESLYNFVINTVLNSKKFNLLR